MTNEPEQRRFESLTLGDLLEAREFHHQYLVSIWESAWRDGGGENIGWAHIREARQSTLRGLYRRESFIRSNYLEDM